jgi:hypothetical protein
LPDLTVRGLHVGRHKLDIRFWRDGGETALEVIKGDPEVVERRNMAPKSPRQPFSLLARAGPLS